MKQQFSRRKFLSTSSQLLAGATALGATLTQQVTAQTASTEITRIDLGHAWVLQGAGGNVYTLPGLTEDGALMIDGGLSAHSEATLSQVADTIGQDRVHTLINTHYHPEQTGSNELVGAKGGVIIAHENTKMCLQNSILSHNYQGRYGPLADVGIPTITTRGNGKMKFAGQKIIYGYLPAAHTNGDLFIYFPILDTLIAGGAVTSDRWPVLDIRQGAWMGGLLRAYEKLSSIVGADTVVIPAHGPIIDGTKIMRMRSMYTNLHLDLAEQLNLGMGPDDIVEMDLLKDYENEFGDPTEFLDSAHRSIQMAYVPN